MIVKHFTSEDLKLYTITLALKKLEEKHLDLNQVIIILDIFNDFEIRNKLSYMIINNTISNNNLINAIAITLHKKGIFYNAY